MSAEWQPQGVESWKVSLPCTRHEGEAIADLGELAGFDPAPVVMASEPDPARPEAWRLDVYLEQAPAPDLIAAIRALAPSAAAAEPVIERIADQDWATLSQRWLEPIHAGRFFVHTAAHAEAVPADAIAFRIEASRAFGTGHHETTEGCLKVLDALAEEGRRFARVLDIGTGTGLLAFAARALWPEARITASDIDPVAIEVAAVNMAANGLPPDALTLVVADGLDETLAASGPYNLIVANILAGPLIAMTPDIVDACAPGATIVLAGLLASQEEAVVSVYRAAGAWPVGGLHSGGWAILTLVAPPDIQDA